jgi:hypothetical protein
MNLVNYALLPEGHKIIRENPKARVRLVQSQMGKGYFLSNQKTFKTLTLWRSQSLRCFIK